MIPVSAEYLQALTRSHRVTAAAGYWQPYDDYEQDILFRVIDGSITVDRGQQVRRMLNCQLTGETTAESLAIDVLNRDLQVWLGVDVGVHVEAISGGVFRVNEVSKGYKDAVSIQATSFEGYVIDDVYYTNMTYPKGMPLLQAIESVIAEALGTAVFEPYSAEVVGRDTPLPYDVVAERDRWEVVEKLSAIIDCDVYCTEQGKFRVWPKPRIRSSSVPVARLRQGPDGVQIALDEKSARTDTFNGVLAMGQSNDPDVPPVSAFVYDADDASPTYWGGPFGKKPYIYENDLLTSKSMCLEKATLLLEDLRTRVESVNLSAIPNPALEPGDLVGVGLLDGSERLYILNQLVIPLRSGAWTAQLATNRDLGIAPPGELERDYNTLRLYEPDGVTVIAPATYEGVLADYADYGTALYPPVT